MVEDLNTQDANVWIYIPPCIENILAIYILFVYHIGYRIISKNAKVFCERKL